MGGLRRRTGPGDVRRLRPRRRSELLVRIAADLIGPGAVVVDLGCGTGALAAALGERVLGLSVYAVDVDPVATDCARANLPDATVLTGDLYEPLPATLEGKVDLLLANAPYVPTASLATLPPEAREHEPRSALDGGADGLDVHRRVITGAPSWLRSGGHLVAEVGHRQAPTAAALMAAAGLRARVLTDDDVGGTAVVGTMLAVDETRSNGGP